MLGLDIGLLAYIGVGLEPILVGGLEQTVALVHPIPELAIEELELIAIEGYPGSGDWV